MKLAMVCCTYLRPQYLGGIIRCFLDQDHPHKELVILDDAGQYESQEGNGWRLVSTTQRYPNLGAKRDAAVALVSNDVEALQVMDDDDLYLPWTLSAAARALAYGDWIKPSLIYVAEPGSAPRMLGVSAGGYVMHASWALRVSAFRRAGGYGQTFAEEDGLLQDRLVAERTTVADPMTHGSEPYFIWRKHNDGYRAHDFVGCRAWPNASNPVPECKLPIVIPDTNPALVLLGRVR
jgi:glycosyltransferase involved in cell wall biosynthesis